MRVGRMVRGVGRRRIAAPVIDVNRGGSIVYVRCVEEVSREAGCSGGVFAAVGGKVTGDRPGLKRNNGRNRQLLGGL